MRNSQSNRESEARPDGLRDRRDGSERDRITCEREDNIHLSSTDAT